MLRPIKNLIKHRFFRDLSIRSDVFGRLRMADLAVRFVRINNIPGDYLEFGVYKGSTFSNFYHLFKRWDLKVNLYAFDSFEGLPKPKGVDAVPGLDQFAEGEFRCTESEFVDEMTARWVPRSAYTVVKGWFEESLTPDLYSKINLTKAAILWIDCDLYESAKAALKWVRPILQDGSLIIFDDYFCFRGNPLFGERRAFNEFLTQNPELQVTDYAEFSSVGKAFIVHLK